MQIYSRYELPPSPSIKFTQPSMTQQHFKDECDINRIIKRYQQTGVLGNPLEPVPKPIYEDVSNLPSFEQSMQTVARTSEYFDSLPSEVRQQFNYNVSDFVRYISDPDNLAKFQQLASMDNYSSTTSDSSLVSAPSQGATGTVAPMPISTDEGKVSDEL